MVSLPTLRLPYCVVAFDMLYPNSRPDTLAPQRIR